MTSNPLLKTPITVKEARKLLGKRYSLYSDEEIQQMILDIEQLARIQIREYLVLNAGVVK